MKTPPIYLIYLAGLLSIPVLPVAAQHSAAPHPSAAQGGQEPTKHDRPHDSLDCASKVIPYSDWSPDEEPSWTLVLDPAHAGALHFYGASHSDDPAHPQFDEIEAAYDSFQPTVVFYEGPVRPLAETREETIRKYGESGFIRFLAERDGLLIERLEPDPGAEMQYVLQQSFTLEQAMLFYVLREAARLRERKGMSEDEIEKEIAGLLDRVSSLMETPIQTIADLDAAYRRHWNEPAQWWQAPSEWFAPSPEGVETGGTFTNAVNRASSHFRNLNMYRVLTEAVLRGERVFAVVGRNHVPMQVDAIKCALGE